MKRNTALILFLGACIIIAVLLLTRLITPIWGGILFAAALVLIGLLSRGFTQR